MMPYNGGQQFILTPPKDTMGTCRCLQYQATVPLVSQPVTPGPMPSFSHVSGQLGLPILANVRPAGNDMAQGSVAAPMAGQQMLNYRGLSQKAKGQSSAIKTYIAKR